MASEGGGPSFEAKYLPRVLDSESPIRAYWIVEGTRLTYLNNKAREHRQIGQIALLDCPAAPNEHGTRLMYDIYDRWCDGVYEHRLSVPIFAIAVGTAIALHHGIEVVCVDREKVRPESETSMLLNLGFERTGEYGNGEFILQHADYLQGAGVGGYTGSDYLGDFMEQSERILGVNLEPITGSIHEF